MRIIYLGILLLTSSLSLSAEENAMDRVLGDSFSNVQAAPKIPDNITVNNDGSLEFDAQKGIYIFQGNVEVTTKNGLQLKAKKALIDAKKELATLTGDVSIRQKATIQKTGKITPGLQLFANKVLLNSKQETITLDGNVSIYEGPSLHRGDHALYDYGNQKLNTSGLSSKIGPIIMESKQFKAYETKGKRYFVGNNAGISTHDSSSPNYWIRSDKTTIFPSDRIILKNLKLYAGDTPIFWFPYLSQPLDADLGLHFLPGVRSRWGAYLLTSYGIMLGGTKDEITGNQEDAWLLSTWNLDILTKRGIGTGLNLEDTRLKYNENLGWLKLYYINDQASNISRTDKNRIAINDNRWKFELKNRWEIQKNADTSTYLDANIMALSDRYFLEDFEPNTFKTEPQPNNEIGIFHRNPRYSAGIYARLRPNNFHQSDTRLPEIFFNQIKAPVFGTPVLYEGQTSLGFYKEYIDKEKEKELIRTYSPYQKKGYSRFHTWHEFSLPLSLDNKINIIPKAGVGVTNYWDFQDNIENITRLHTAVGVDASMKFSKVYPNIKNKSFGIDGLLHIFQPYATFSQLKTSNTDKIFRGIETVSRSTRPPSLEVGRYSSIDDLEDWTTLRLGGRNLLFSRRDGNSLQWLSLDTYIDVFLDDPESSRALSNLYNDLTWNPLPWMKLDLETQFPLEDDKANFSELSSSLTFMPNDFIEFEIGYRLLHNHPTLENSSRVDLRSYIRINDEWGLSTYHRYESDDNTLELQQYQLYHDFDSWRTSLGFLIRDNRQNDDEFSLMLNFTLKNFPMVRLPLSVDSE